MNRFVSVSAGGVLFFVVFFGFSGCSHRQIFRPASKVQSVISKSGEITETDLGVPLYPNAKPMGERSFINHANPNSRTPSITSVSMTTPDSVDQVEDFYRDKIGKNARVSTYESAGGKLVHIDAAKGNRMIRMEILPLAKGPGSIIVVLTQWMRK